MKRTAEMEEYARSKGLEPVGDPRGLCKCESCLTGETESLYVTLLCRDVEGKKVSVNFVNPGLRPRYHPD